MVLHIPLLCFPLVTPVPAVSGPAVSVVHTVNLACIPGPGRRWQSSAAHDVARAVQVDRNAADPAVVTPTLLSTSVDALTGTL